MNHATSLVPWLTDSRSHLAALKQNNALSHALLLIGRDGGGQHQLADFVARDILCEDHSTQTACGQCHTCQLMQANTHPDFHLLDGQDESIKIEHIRNILGKVSQKSQIAPAKVVLIKQASSMNINASNAVLKALEEPPSGTFFILTSDTNSRLLPTIRSRCLLQRLPMPTQQQAQGWLDGLQCEEDVSDLFWLTQEPFQLAAIAQAKQVPFYLDLPAKVQQYLQDGNVDEVMAALDKKNSTPFSQGLLALLHQCICYSTGEQVPNIVLLQTCFDALLAKLGIHRIMQCFQRLQELVDKSQKTHLNMALQLRAELIFWTAS